MKIGILLFWPNISNTILRIQFSHTASPILYHPIPNEENLFIHILNKYCTTFLYQQLQFPLFVTK